MLQVCQPEETPSKGWDTWGGCPEERGSYCTIMLRQRDDENSPFRRFRGSRSEREECMGYHLKNRLVVDRGRLCPASALVGCLFLVYSRFDMCDGVLILSLRL